MPSPKLARLQDESVTVTAEIETLRAMVPADEAEAKSINERLSERSNRAEEITAAAVAERALDAKVEALKAVRASDSEPLAAVEKKTAPAVHVVPKAQLRGFGTYEAADRAGRFLRALARKDKAELRAMAGTSASAGEELLSPELFNGFIDVLQYSSVGLQLASLYPTSTNSIIIPKIGEIVADWFDENESITGDEATTDKVEITLYKMGRLIEVSNELVEDAASGVALASTVANRLGLAIAKKIDDVWLNGDNGKGIDGLVDEIPGGNEVEAGTDMDGADLAEIVGKIDSRAMNTAWVVSSEGWGHIMASSVVSQSTTIGERVLPVVMGAPVYRVLGLPAGTLALYGDFSMSSAVAYKANGLQIASSVDAGFAKDQVVFRGTQRVGISNHDASFVAKLVSGS
jgi:HK97 family phage major capsid protein